MLYIPLWLRIWRAIVLESSEFSLQHLQKYLQSLEKNQFQLFGVHSWTFRGWGGTQLERVEGERLATPQNAIVYCTLHSSTAPKSLKDLPRHSYNWGPAIELPPYPPNIPGILNPGMALGSDFILSQSMKSQVDYSWSIMRKHVLRQTPINYWM